MMLAEFPAVVVTVEFGSVWAGPLFSNTCRIRSLALGLVLRQQVRIRKIAAASLAESRRRDDPLPPKEHEVDVPNVHSLGMLGLTPVV